MTSGVFTIPWISTDGSSCDSSPDCVATPGHRYFLAGPENALLRELVHALAGELPRYNPITLCGPTGVGKSHLLHGLVEYQKTWKADGRATVLTGADFARGLARAIEIDSVADWRNKHSNADSFVLDDLQELDGKPVAQQELIHVIDRFLDRDQQLILASRHAALDWHWMLPGLRSRLQGGLVIPIALPGELTQQRMVQSILQDHGLPATGGYVLPETATGLTYTQIRHSILQYFQTQANDSQEACSETAHSSKGALRQIAKLVARQSQIKLADLLGPSRRQTVVQARGIAFYVARQLLKISFQEIGEFFGGRDHTTVLHSWRNTRQRLENDARFKHEVNTLIGLLADNFEIQPS